MKPVPHDAFRAAEGRGFASLTSGLLARKGQAKPAMRPQAMLAPRTPVEDDLGWNDMGEAPAPQSVPVPAIPEPVAPAPEPVAETLPESVAETPSEPEPEPAAEAPAVAPEVALVADIVASLPPKARAAFTLRLDPERHLRLRLAAAVARRSAQAIVTEALDAHLSALPHATPELEALAASRLPRRS